MDMLIDYSFVFDQALAMVKTTRSFNGQQPETQDFNWDVVIRNNLFDYSDSDYNEYSVLLSAAHEYAISCINGIVLHILNKAGYVVERVIDIPDDALTRKIKLAVNDVSHNRLLIFKEIEECCFWKNKESEPECIRLVMQKTGAKSCKYIYYMLDYAYLQVVGYNDDRNDPGRGYNIFSLKWFWEEYFGKDEYSRFEAALMKYQVEVKNYLGYFVMKSLTPYTLLNFRKIVENRLCLFSYEQLLGKKIKPYSRQMSEFTLPEADFQKVKQQYLG